MKPSRTRPKWESSSHRLLWWITFCVCVCVCWVVASSACWLCAFRMAAALAFIWNHWHIAECHECSSVKTLKESVSNYFFFQVTQGVAGKKYIQTTTKALIQLWNANMSDTQLKKNCERVVLFSDVGQDQTHSSHWRQLNHLPKTLIATKGDVWVLCVRVDGNSQTAFSALPEYLICFVFYSARRRKWAIDRGFMPATLSIQGPFAADARWGVDRARWSWPALLIS